MEAKEILKKLIAFPTNSWKYDNSIKKFIITLFNSFDKEIINIPGTKDRCFVIKLKAKKKLKKAIAFLCHIDTVVPSDSWRSEPYKALITKNRAIGLGASDMKGSIASLIKAIGDLGTLERDVLLMFTSDEETTVADIKKLKKKIKLNNCLIIATEPTEGNITVGQKGIIEIRVTTVGVSSHASNADLSENKKNNAIYKMALIMQKIKEQELELNKQASKKYGFSTINFGKICGGSAVNVMSNKCSLEVSYRLNPSIDADKYFSQIISDFKKTDPTAKVELLLRGLSFDSGDVDSVGMIKKIIENVAGRANIEYGKSWSEVAELSRNNDCMIVGPGSPMQAHKAGEFISIAKLNQFCQIYSDIITNV